MGKVLVIGSTGNEWHEGKVRDAFVKGYNDSASELGLSQISTVECEIRSTPSLDFQGGFNYCKTNDIPIMICSYTGVASRLKAAQANYPEVTLFMPTGANEPGEIFSGEIPQVICITGAGDIANETADNVEFIAPDPIENDEQDYSSYANGYIAGQILAIADKLGCSIWEARYRAAMTGSEGGTWDEINGYGFVRVGEAVSYAGGVADDPFLPSSCITTIEQIRAEGNLSNDINDEQLQSHLKKASSELKILLGNLYLVIVKEKSTLRKTNCSLAEANLALSYAVVPLNIESAGSGIMQSKGFGESKNELIGFSTAENLAEYFRGVAMKFIEPYLPKITDDGASSSGYLIGAL